VNSGERKALAEQGIKTDDLSGFTRQARDTVEKANAAAQQNVEEAEKQATGE
jgi:F0F1-type ATP synthase membrane subunit b/b'